MAWSVTEAGKRYGTFSHGAKNRAQRNIDFANQAWQQLMQMAAQGRMQNIRSEDMTSINNQRYSQWIQGGWNPSLVGRGKQGMKIFNNATNHNIGQRLLSGAALIDNKQMILSFQGGGKSMRPRMKPYAKGEKPVYTEEEKKQQAEWDAHLKEVEKQRADRIAKRTESNIKGAERFNQQANLVQTAMNQQANETPFTGQAYQQAVENQRQEKIEKFHEKAEELGKGFEAALMADLAVSAAPLLQRGFRWAFNKAGQLVKVPIIRNRIVGKEFSNSDIVLPDKYGIETFSPKIINHNPEKLQNNISTIEWNEAKKPTVNWNADNWFKTISGRNSYSQEEAAELASHIPEYKEIEKRLFDEGKLIINSEGNIVVKGSEMSPQEYIMRQSEAFQKMNPEHHYVGVRQGLVDSFENKSRDPSTKNRYEVWTDKKSPENVEEYAFSGFGGQTADSQIKKLRKQLASYTDENGSSNYFRKKELEEARKSYERGEVGEEYYNQWVDKINRSYDNTRSMIEQNLNAAIRQKEIDPLNGGKIYDVTYPKNVSETPIIDAEGRHWTEIPYENVKRDSPDLVSHFEGKPHPDEFQTDIIVNMAKRHGYPVTHINNVMDTANGTLLNETIIGKNVPVKSVLGNTGSFDIDSPNKWKLFRSWIPWFLGGSAAATLYNKSK